MPDDITGDLRTPRPIWAGECGQQSHPQPQEPPGQSDQPAAPQPEATAAPLDAAPAPFAGEML